VSYLLEMLRKTGGVVIGLSNRQATDTPICRLFEDGSDGTRTRDLRRDRPLRGREVNDDGRGTALFMRLFGTLAEASA